MYKFLIYAKKLNEETGRLYSYLLLDDKVVYNTDTYCKIERRLTRITDKKKAYMNVTLIPCPYFLYYDILGMKKDIPTLFEISFERLDCDKCYLQWRGTYEFSEEINEILKFI